MKKIVLSTLVCLIVIVKAKSQVILNEIYSDPGAGKHEFFELYNTSGSTVPMSLDDYSIVTFFEISGKKGFYVLDIPNLSINPQGYFVGSSAIPFNYQGVTGSTASDFSWNDPLLVLNTGYLKKWEQGTANLADGNPYYDEAPLPANFNDFFFRRMAAGASYSVFVYKNGTLVNTFIGGTGGNTTVITAIVNMPQLYVDMINPASTDYAIDFSLLNLVPLEYCIQDAGSDNGYIRIRDGACGMWDKSSAGVQHTPQQTNGGKADAYTGTISVESAIVKGTAATGSTVHYNVVAAGTEVFPVEMMIYVDNGTIPGELDPADTYVESTFEYALGEGPFSTTFMPYDADVLIVVKSSAGCIDKIQYLPNTGVLSAKLESFHGNLSDNKVLLGWTVLQNEAADHYEVEKSQDGITFSTVTVLEASSRIGKETYGLYDRLNNSEKVYYRLKIVDNSQKAEYSKTIMFQASQDTKQGITLLSNPVTDKLSMRFELASSQPASVQVYDINGRKIMAYPLGAQKGTNQVILPLPASMHAGIYVAEVTSGTTRYNTKFIRQ